MTRPRCRRVMLVIALGSFALCNAAADAQPEVERLPAPAASKVPAEQAFDQLGKAADAHFVLDNGVTWTADQTVEPQWAQKTLWEAVLELAYRTGYEPAFHDYIETPDGPAIVLRHVDAAESEGVRPALASGHLLIRPKSAAVVRDAEAAQRTLQPVQVEVECELFIEPRLAWMEGEEPDRPVAVYATAAGLRAEGRSLAGGPEAASDLQLNRTAEADPTVALHGGTGLLRLRFDADQRAPYLVPAEVATWRALVRVIYAEAWAEATVELPVADEEGKPGHRWWEVGPWRVQVEDVRVRAIEDGPRRATVSLWLGRGGGGGLIPLGDWFRLYHFLQSIPPKLRGPGGDWEPAGYIVIGELDDSGGPGGEPNPLLANAYRVLAIFREPVGGADDGPGEAEPFALSWRLPTESSEARLPVVWTTTVAVQPALKAPAQREATTMQREHAQD